MSDDPVVSMEDVTVHFEDESLFGGLFSEEEPVRAVDGVSLEIGERDVVALVGESGCGKTTLGKAAIGIQRPSEGTIRYRGQDIWAAKEGRGTPEIPFEEIRRSLQIIHQDPGSALNPNQTVQATLATPLKYSRTDLSTLERRALVAEMLDRVGMTPADDYASRYPHQLSGGEKQRVALVRALLMEPDLILADEAVSALDVSLRVEMMDLMLSLQEDFGTSYVFISHDLSNARYIAEQTGGRIGVMYMGELVELGPVEEVIGDPKHPYTRVLKWATPSLRPTKGAAEEPPIRRVDVPDPTDPPSGCRFHTRCPEARDACRAESPELTTGDDVDHAAACFRQFEDHPYWDSPPIDDEVEEEPAPASR